MSILAPGTWEDTSFPPTGHLTAHFFPSGIIRAALDRPPQLGKIIATLKAIISADKQINPPELKIIDKDILCVKCGI